MLIVWDVGRGRANFLFRTLWGGLHILPVAPPGGSWNSDPKQGYLYIWTFSRSAGEKIVPLDCPEPSRDHTELRRPKKPTRKPGKNQETDSADKRQFAPFSAGTVAAFYFFLFVPGP